MILLYVTKGRASLSHYLTLRMTRGRATLSPRPRVTSVAPVLSKTDFPTFWRCLWVKKGLLYYIEICFFQILHCLQV